MQKWFWKPGLSSGRPERHGLLPAGTTIEGVRTLEKNGFRSAVFEALTAAAEKGKNYNFLKASNGQAAKYPPSDLIRFSIVTDMKKLRVILPSCRLHGVFLSYVSYRI